MTTFDRIRSTILHNVKLLTCCCYKLGVDIIMWIPMSNQERSRCIRWRLSCPPGGRSESCLRYTH
ncbi:hypothetical protein BDC45DRAFT_450240 [Circinella umbellata]|nr:hypothetical protein BDC45DRAFT_450240 [Circinella umbellata]